MLHRILSTIFPAYRIAQEARAMTLELIAIARAHLAPLGYEELAFRGLWNGSLFKTDKSYFNVGMDMRDFEFCIRFRAPGESDEALPDHVHQYKETYALREPLARNQSVLPHRPRLEAEVRRCLSSFDTER
jgi:hypothetical protein